MSKAKAKAKQVKGKMKETTGKAMDDESMQVEAVVSKSPVRRRRPRTRLRAV